MSRGQGQIRTYPGRHGASRQRWLRDWAQYVLLTPWKTSRLSLLLSLLVPVGAVSYQTVFFCCLSYLQPASVIFSDESWPVESAVSCVPVRLSPCVMWPSGFSLGGAEKYRCLSPGDSEAAESWESFGLDGSWLKESQSWSCLFICPRRNVLENGHGVCLLPPSEI